jgi:hypothetical protein
MPVDRSRYRLVNYLGARILQARELNKQQAIDRHQDDTVSGTYSPSAYELGAAFREGATLNVTATPTGTNVALSATDVAKPMLVFIRGKWEKLKTAEAPSVALGGAGTKVYLNWELKKITSADDAQLIDATTLEDTAEMGELILSVSATDTSGVALSGTQFEKNTAAIELFTYTNNGAALTAVPMDNLLAQAYGTDTKGGLAKLSTGTASGVACSNDDSRLTDTRVPTNLSVTNGKVAVPVAAGGNNADGTPIYAAPGSGAGISAAKIILDATTQLLSDGWTWLKNKVLSVESDFNSHKTAALGLGNTHPMPTATEVGATAIAHQGKALNLPDTHPIAVTQNTGGFRIVRNNAVAPIPADYAFEVSDGATKAGMAHDGEIYSSKANVSTAPGSDGDGVLVTTGALGSMSTIAAALAEHINKIANKNPHGLTAGDIGAATTGYVDTADQNVLSAAIAFADLMGSISVRKHTSLAPTSFLLWGGIGPGEAFRSQATITKYFGWTIFTLAGRFEIAFGAGTLMNGESLSSYLPPTDGNGSWNINNTVGTAGMGGNLDKNDLNSPTWASAVGNMTQVSDGAGGYRPGTIDAHWNSSFGNYSLSAAVTAVAWRTITANPILISLSPTSGTTGASITISGRNFGSSIPAAVVTFGGVAATVTSCNPTQIQCTVPAGAALGAITVAITVDSRAGINTLTFTKS